ncbi:M13 family metallopeptidase [Psychrobium sp. 1_MG-2023]|uniref:M13 family metallopeptidase n=1 Tax=Psychrobium sp. 1_MG-2023 TaxID=3062624 RepID=UPI000C328231|nr:M13 family metallopeptidase [Psychrobium sp. 1_MG-2023]MDP2561139.1 M13 family metallopeptidase [Psychrobium sp. 1_MG-2023]PKF55115.1 peptidase M13 [Alteromonadales bacterium alter-6D02]
MKLLKLTFLMILLTNSVIGCSSVPKSAFYFSATSGIGQGYFDPNVRLQDDLYQAVNGHWLNTVTIPQERSSHGAFSQLTDQTQAVLKHIIKQAATKPLDSEQQKIGDLFNSYMGEKRAERLGITPLASQLKAINAAESYQSITELMAKLSLQGVNMPIGYYVNADAKASATTALHIHQSGLSLPDRSYYLDSTADISLVRHHYRMYIERLFSFANASHSASNVIAIEKVLAKAHWSRSEARSATNKYNKFLHSEINQLFGDFSWQQFSEHIQVQNQPYIIVSQPSFVAAFGKAFFSFSINAWRDYLTFKLIDHYAPLLNKDLVNLHFGFHQEVLVGVKTQRPRWKKALDFTDNHLGELIGKQYVNSYVSTQLKPRMREMIKMLIKGFSLSINELDWMSDKTKLAAQKKLSKFRYKIAAPNHWPDHSTLVITPNNLVQNYQNIMMRSHQRMLDELTQPVDRNKWFMTPQSVNAYYNPAGNEIVFPAAILQPPFFNVHADDAINYGAIGAIIGHELIHGFDDQGAKYDGDGNLNNWWSPEDKQQFNARAKKLAQQYSNFKPFDDLGIDGELTLGENIADLGGLTIAARAYTLSLNGQPSKIIDGYTGEQRLFIGWSQIWRRKYSEKALRQKLMIGPHSPGHYRVLGTPRNIDAFYRAFNIKTSDGMYLAPEKRVKIW